MLVQETWTIIQCILLFDNYQATHFETFFYMYCLTQKIEDRFKPWIEMSHPSPGRHASRNVAF